jgi:hypothetical protein
VQEHKVTLEGEATAIWDLMGEDTILFHHAAEADDESMATQYVKQSHMWFDSIWSTIARDGEP